MDEGSPPSWALPWSQADSQSRIRLAPSRAGLTDQDGLAGPGLTNHPFLASLAPRCLGGKDSGEGDTAGPPAVHQLSRAGDRLTPNKWGSQGKRLKLLGGWGQREGINALRSLLCSGAKR